MKIWKILFWTCTILLGFVNPLISVGLIILYYLPGIIQDLCNPCKETESGNYTLDEFVNAEEKDEQNVVRNNGFSAKMNSFSDKTLEEFK